MSAKRLSALAATAAIACSQAAPSSGAVAVLGAASCPAVAGHLAPDEARQAATGLLQSYPVSPTLTRYAMGIAAASANATPKVPPPSLVPIVSEPAPKLGQAQEAASACGYTGQVRGIAIAPPMQRVDDNPRFDVDVALPKLRGSAAVGIGVAFDRFGDLHVVYVGGTVNDNDGSDPFASYTESKPARPLPHPTGFLVVVYIDGVGDIGGARIRVYRGSREVGHGVTNRMGVVNIVVPGPGRYAVASSFVYKGHRYTGKSVVPAMKGRMMPFTINACAPGEFGC